MKEFSISPEELRAKQEAAQASRVEDCAGLRRVAQATAEPTHSGWLRRQIRDHHHVSLQRICKEAGIGPYELNDFLEGLGPLSTVQVDGICKVLGIVPAAADKVA